MFKSFNTLKKTKNIKNWIIQKKKKATALQNKSIVLQNKSIALQNKAMVLQNKSMVLQDKSMVLQKKKNNGNGTESKLD